MSATVTPTWLIVAISGINTLLLKRKIDLTGFLDVTVNESNPRA